MKDDVGVWRDYVTGEIVNPDTHCSKCGDPFSKYATKMTTGYGVKEDGTKICFKCCGEEDREYMRTHDRMTLYLTVRQSDGKVHVGTPGLAYMKHFVTNWPGTLEIPVPTPKVGLHNIAGRRYDVWFDFEGRTWHGVQYGDNTQILHCRKLKAK